MCVRPYLQNFLFRGIKKSGLSKCHLRYRGPVYFEAARSESTYATLNYLKNSNKFYEDITISYGLSSSEILNLADGSLAHE